MLPKAHAVGFINQDLLNALISLVNFSSNLDETQLLLTELTLANQTGIWPQLSRCRTALHIQPNAKLVLFADNIIFADFARQVNWLPFTGKLLNRFDSELFATALEDVLAGKEYLDPRIDVSPSISTGSSPKPATRKVSVKINGLTDAGETKRMLERAWFPALDQSDTSVVISFLVGQSGKASQTNISKSSGKSSVDEAAVKAIHRCAFGKLTAGTLVEVEFLDVTT